ncbi:MAG TPA: serine/threonine-protein kinase, partial [Gemmataceae bacterium]|nr:serine/threonine-protein kinase [Gemmataceae bacterium]
MDSRAAALSDLLLEWEECRERGEPADVEALCATCPDLLGPFQEMVEKLLQWERYDPSGPTDSGPLPPAEFPRPFVAGYTVRERIGEGATSIVYRAEDAGTGLPVAVKVLRPRSYLRNWDGRSELLQRFEQEARLLARLNHDGIVRIFLSRLQDSPPFFVMEYLPGGNLIGYAPQLRARGLAAITRFVELVARAVGEAHRHGTLHRDLKPSNILLDANGHPHVSDFGIAKLLADDRDAGPSEPTSTGDTATHVLCPLTVIDHQPGTLPYMAPEQYDPRFGSVGFATDVWALGVILYELLAGAWPFAAPEGSTRDAWRERVCRAPAPVLRLGRGRLGRCLARVVARCLEKDPARRYPDAEALANALRDCEAPGGWSRLRHAAMIAGVGLVAAALVPGPRPVAPPEASAQTALDPYHISTLQASAALGRGEPVDFVPRVVAGAYARSDRDLRVRACPDGFTVEYGGKWALLELMPRLPRGKYTLEAELRHDATSFNSDGDVGLYCWGSSIVKQGQTHFVIASLTFSDRGMTADNGASVMIYYLHGNTKNRSVPFPSADAIHLQAGPGGWRQLVWQLSPEDAQASFDGKPFHRRLIVKDFDETLKDAERAGITATVRPDGAFGIYISRATLT